MAAVTPRHISQRQHYQPLMDIFYSLNIEAAASRNYLGQIGNIIIHLGFAYYWAGMEKSYFQLAVKQQPCFTYIPGMCIGALAFYGACNSFQGTSSNRVSIRVIVQRKTLYCFMAWKFNCLWIIKMRTLEKIQRSLIFLREYLHDNKTSI